MCASDGLFAVFAVGEKNVEALVAVVADKVIGWHAVILTESAPGGERCATGQGMGCQEGSYCKDASSKVICDG